MLWILPAFGANGDVVVPIPLVFWAIAVLVVSVACLAGFGVAWLWPGLLAVLGLLWAVALVPDVLGSALRVALPAWPSLPSEPPAVALWRLVALVLGTATSGGLAMILVPRSRTGMRMGRPGMGGPAGSRGPANRRR